MSQAWVVPVLGTALTGFFGLVIALLTRSTNRALQRETARLAERQSDLESSKLDLSAYEQIRIAHMAEIQRVGDELDDERDSRRADRTQWEHDRAGMREDIARLDTKVNSLSTELGRERTARRAEQLECDEIRRQLEVLKGRLT